VKRPITTVITKEERVEMKAPERGFVDLNPMRTVTLDNPQKSEEKMENRATMG
jgi:hypothetical protein